MEIGSRISVLDITIWWSQQEDMDLNYVNLSNVAHNIFCTILHGGGLEASFSHRRDVFGWRVSRTRGATLCEKFSVRHFAAASHGILACGEPVFDTMNTDNLLDMEWEEEWKNLHSMPMVDDFFGMRQGNQNLHATHMESRAQNKHMSAIEYISDTEETVNACWLHYHSERVAEFQLSERSPVPPTWSAKDRAGGQTEVFSICTIKPIKIYPGKSHEDISPECM